MDAFIIRTPRANVKAVAKSKAPIKGQQQRRLNDLRGVVVLEDIQKYVKRLKSDKVESSEKVRILQRLAPKQPSTKIISGNLRRARLLSDSKKAFPFQFVQNQYLRSRRTEEISAIHHDISRLFSALYIWRESKRKILVKLCLLFATCHLTRNFRVENYLVKLCLPFAICHLTRIFT